MTRALVNPPTRQQGMAVIAALLVVAAAAVIASTMLNGQNARAQLLRGEKSRVQARELLLGSIEWVRGILRDDGRRSPITSADQRWAIPIVNLRIDAAGQADAAVLSGRIDDEQGKFNLQNLARDGHIDTRQVMALQRLLQALNPGPALHSTLHFSTLYPALYPALHPAIAADIARRIADAQPLTTGNGASTSDAASSVNPLTPPRAPGLQSLDDLRGMNGVDDPLIERLRCCITILPDHTPVNINTAPPEVLYAVIDRLSLGQAAALVAERDRGLYFNDAADFVNRLANQEIKVAKDSISTGSEWFGLAGVVRLDHATVAMRALLRRDDDQSTSIVWTREIN